MFSGKHLSIAILLLLGFISIRLFYLKTQKSSHAKSLKNFLGFPINKAMIKTKKERSEIKMQRVLIQQCQ